MNPQASVLFINFNKAETAGHVCVELEAIASNLKLTCSAAGLCLYLSVRKRLPSHLTCLFYPSLCCGEFLYTIHLISPPLFSIHLRHRRLWARLEEVPWPLLQVWIIKKKIQNFASNTSGVPRPCLPPLSALKPVTAWSYSPSTRHLNLPGCVWNMYFNICFGGLFPTGTSHTDTLGRMQRRTVESTAPTSVASSLLPSRSSLMVQKCLSLLDHRKVALLSPARVFLCAACMFSRVRVGFCKEIRTYCIKFYSLYT